MSTDTGAPPVSDAELLPCPRGTDGCHPYLAEWEDRRGGLTTPIAQVRCDCGMSGPETYGAGNRREAVEAWNTRSHSTALTRLEGLKADIEREIDGFRYQPPEMAGEILYRIALAVDACNAKGPKL